MIDSNLKKNKPTKTKDWKEEFFKKFTVNLTRTFFGDREKLAKEGWKVGGNLDYVFKNDIKLEDIADFIESLLKEQEKEIEKNIRFTLKQLIWEDRDIDAFIEKVFNLSKSKK